MSATGRLVVCPTPIGNLEDVTLRVLAALREADLIACEDTRRTRILLDRYGVTAPLLSYHEHNERERAGDLVARMRAGETVALVSDAGMPLVSDPGYVLVQACVAAGLPIEVLPAPAALAALVACALPSDRWRFVGFLPRKRGDLLRMFATPETLVAFEAPRRVATLEALAEQDPERPVAVCRELTKLHEEVGRGTAGSRPSATPSRLRVARSCSCSARRRRPTPTSARRSGSQAPDRGRCQTPSRGGGRGGADRCQRQRALQGADRRGRNDSPGPRELTLRELGDRRVSAPRLRRLLEQRQLDRVARRLRVSGALSVTRSVTVSPLVPFSALTSRRPAASSGTLSANGPLL